MKSGYNEGRLKMRRGDNMKLIAFGVREDERPYFKEWVSQKENLELKLVPELISDETIDQIKGFDGIVSLQTTPYKREYFEKMKAAGIKVLSIRNIGIDNIDLEAAKDNQIPITNVPAYSPSAIAEFTITQLMQLIRHTKQFNEKMQRQDFRWEPNISTQINQMTIGVMGTGRIGRAVIKLLQGLGATVIAYDPYENAELKAEKIYVNSVDELYAKSNAITLHMPATKDDYHLFNSETFKKMKDGVLIINTARGTLIDSKALITALDSGKVGGAALDTYEHELPIFDHNLAGKKINDEVFNNLYKRDNVLITPHIAFYTTEAVKNMVNVALDCAYTYLTTGKQNNPVVKID